MNGRYKQAWHFPLRSTAATRGVPNQWNASLIFTPGNSQGTMNYSESSFQWNNLREEAEVFHPIINEQSLTPRNLGSLPPVWRDTAWARVSQEGDDQGAQGGFWGKSSGWQSSAFFFFFLREDLLCGIQCNLSFCLNKKPSVNSIIYQSSWSCYACVWQVCACLGEESVVWCAGINCVWTGDGWEGCTMVICSRATYNRATTPIFTDGTPGAWRG